MEPLINNKNRILLCCGGKQCPILEKQDNNIIIIDDVGNRAYISIEQALLLSDYTKKLLEQTNK